jgi:hypothetical protein
LPPAAIAAAGEYDLIEHPLLPSIAAVRVRAVDGRAQLSSA